jgi:transposase
MKPVLSVRPRHSIAELRHALAHADDEAQKTRIRVIINIREGATRTQIVQRFSICPNTVRNWIRVYNDGGLDALSMSKGGRPEGNPKWNTALFDNLVKEIDKGGRYWSIPLMVEWLKEHYKENVPENTVWYHLKRLNYSHKSARPHPYKGNKERQETFKKGVS